MPRRRGPLRWYHRQVHGEAIVTSSTTPNAAAFRRLSWGVFLVAFPLGILAFVLPIYGRELGASAVEVGAFFSAFSIVPVAVRPFLGRALDRWGRRPFLLLGLGGYVAAMGLFAFADNVLLLTVARFIQGLGQAFLWLSAYTIVADLAAAHTCPEPHTAPAEHRGCGAGGCWVAAGATSARSTRRSIAARSSGRRPASERCSRSAKRG